MKGIIKAVCISEKKGTAKKNIQECNVIQDWGLENDAHAGKWHRQVSLLSYEKVCKFKENGIKIEGGAFGENLLVEGLDFKSYPVGTAFTSGSIVLEITQIGKECHSECAIRKQVGDCIMPREGVFARVLRGGVIKAGDEILPVEKNGFTAALITASDRSFRGEREDKATIAMRAVLKSEGYDVAEEILLPDEEEEIYKAIVRLCDDKKVDLLLTSGGTGFSVRDVTPEATMRASERNVPGIAEAIRAFSMKITDRAMLSRGVSMIRGKTLVVNLPGSPKAVYEALGFIVKPIQHGLEILNGATE